MRYTIYNMEHDPIAQKQYFEFAYQTGGDIWTHIPYWELAAQMLPPHEKNALVLDIGTGRGLLVTKLIEHGLKVIGIDYVEAIVNKANKDLVQEGYSDRARIMQADVLDMPFAPLGFDMATDVGTLQHLPAHKWRNYVDELVRVLKPHAYYLNISLSRKTKSFLGWSPHTHETGDFSKFGVHYHFFSGREINHIFEDNFIIIDQQFKSYNSHSDPRDDIALVFTLMQKK